MPHPRWLSLRGARAHNLRGVDAKLPHDAITVITGVSGSGKSSLAVDALLLEARRRYLGAVAGPAAHRLGKLGRSRVGSVDGLRAGVLLGQSTPGGGPRSTVGTLSGLLDLLRLLVARVGVQHCASCLALVPGTAGDGDRPCPHCGTSVPAPLAGLLSFNTVKGACPRCRGLGVVDRVDPDLLVADAAKSLRSGALVPTTPKPYIVYSQVTMEVLDIVCRAHGFTVDVPWVDLTDEQRAVVFHGSDRVVVPFGKHPLSSRMRWSGITARPREEGHYKGIVTTIQGILEQKRNPGVLRFVRSVACEDCEGTRLGPAARALRLDGRGVGQWSAQPVSGLLGSLATVTLEPAARAVAQPLLEALEERLGVLEALGLGHLRLDRATDSLSGGEARRVQLAGCLAGGLGGLLYVLDEPSAGLHPAEIGRLVAVLGRLRRHGNTVVLVEHDPAVVCAADWVLDLGPGAGAAGGRLLFEGRLSDWLGEAGALAAPDSPSRLALCEKKALEWPTVRPPSGWLRLLGASAHNLRDADLALPLGCLVALTGVSGAGKTTLAVTTLARALSRRAGVTGRPPGEYRALEGADVLSGVVVVDAAPIGRTPRSNAATYTKLFDAVRKLFASQPLAKQRGWGASRFSFNTRGGRCERCEGAGSLRVGMHFLPDAHVVCPECEGVRFDDATLEVRYRGRDIHDVLELSVRDALDLFAGERPVCRALRALSDVGLGYLPLGQPATTLSGGEARRVKLAAQLARKTRGQLLYVLDEPSVGLHPTDVGVLVRALKGLVERGHSVLVVDHDLGLLRAADWIVDLGPGSGEEGGRVLACGTPAQLAAVDASATGRALAGVGQPLQAPGSMAEPVGRGPISLRGVRTHNLSGIDLDIPRDTLCVVTGVSGSGKSSLAFDTLHAEAWRRFAATLPGEARRRLARLPRPPLGSATGLGPGVAVGQRAAGRNPRSTVGTVAGIMPSLRLLYSRFGKYRCPVCATPVPHGACPECDARPPAILTAGHFSFNRELGACGECGGLGSVRRCDPERLVSHPERSLWDGALEGSKIGRYLGEPHGQHLATLEVVGRALDLDLRRPWCDLGDVERGVVLEGTGQRSWTVRWKYQRGKRTGEHHFEGRWPGLLALVQAEWERKHADSRSVALRPLMGVRVCSACEGRRLGPWPRSVRLAGVGLGELCALPLMSFATVLSGWDGRSSPLGPHTEPSADLRRLLRDGVRPLIELGLGYLSLDRPTDSLSGGEARRVQLAGLLAASLSGMTCVLDEPTQGLHARDTAALTGWLRRLVDRGNTVVVVEHDLAVVDMADHVVEIGPGPGERGGLVVARGSPEVLECDPRSLTGAWLRGERSLPTRGPGSLDGPPIELVGIERHNLRDVDVSIPTRGLVGVCGVSGSGKSTLVFEVLAQCIGAGRARWCRSARGVEGLDLAASTSEGRHTGAGTSTVATLAGLMDPLRAAFAGLPAARASKTGRAAFSYTSARGRCPTCRGMGRTVVSLELLADAWVGCESCGGGRYRPEVLAFLLEGLNIGQALELSVEQVPLRFEGVAGLARPCGILRELGLGYLKLGQSVRSLSGGEARRLLLARALLEGGEEGHRRLFLLDEPSVGLHPEDTVGLLGVLDRLVKRGDTVILVEHDLGLLARCDWLIELGPEGGPGGGRVVAQGPPARVAAREGSWTGAALRNAGVLRDGTEP